MKINRIFISKNRLRKGLLIHFLLSIFIFSTISSIAQKDSFIIVDNTTLNPIDFATVISGSSILFSDENGRFSKPHSKQSILEISRIGYENLKVFTVNINDTIFLQPISYSLQEIIVKPSYEVFEVGYLTYKTCGYKEANDKEIFGVYIPSTGKPAIINSFLVHMHESIKDIKCELFIFETTAYGEPQNLIYTQKFSPASARKKLRIPIHSNIIMPENGVFVGMKHNEEGYLSKVKITNEIPENRAFSFFMNHWIPLKNPDKSYFLNMKMGLELIQE